MTDHKTLVVADDFTGAMDTGVKFIPMGGVRVIPEPLKDMEALWADASTLAVDTETRNLDQVQARERLKLVCRIANPEPDTLLFKKVDSTLRGNVGTEIDEIMNSMSITVTCLAPASPDQGRVVRCGVCYLRGVPLHETESGNDLIQPVRSSVVEEIIAARSSRRTEQLPLHIVRAGTDALAAAVRLTIERGAEVVIADAETDADLENIACAFMAVGKPLLYAGSAGLAQAIVQSLEAGARGRGQLPWPAGS